MAVKTFILLALLIFPSILNAQSYKEAFSVELKLDKTNFDFGEDVNTQLSCLPVVFVVIFRRVNMQ